jgi:hypothetical protein
MNRNGTKVHGVKLPITAIFGTNCAINVTVSLPPILLGHAAAPARYVTRYLTDTTIQQLHGGRSCLGSGVSTKRFLNNCHQGENVH